MRKIIVLSFITLDGVMQAPGGPEEDPIGGFTSGGWTVPYFDDFLGQTMTEQMSRPFDLLLGRKTYEIFAAYWPHHNDEGAGLNKANELWLKIFPITLGMGKRLFAEGTTAAAFTLREAITSPRGVIVASYDRAGEVQTGSFA